MYKLRNKKLVFVVVIASLKSLALIPIILEKFPFQFVSSMGQLLHFLKADLDIAQLYYGRKLVLL